MNTVPFSQGHNAAPAALLESGQGGQLPLFFWHPCLGAPVRFGVVIPVQLSHIQAYCLCGRILNSILHLHGVFAKFAWFLISCKSYTKTAPKSQHAAYGGCRVSFQSRGFETIQMTCFVNM